MLVSDPESGDGLIESLRGGRLETIAAVVPRQADWPPALSSHMMAAVPGRGVVVFGGVTPARAPSSSLWVWDGTTWTEDAAVGPPARLHAALAYDPVRQRLVLHGGIGAQFETLADLWEWDGETWQEIPVSGADPGRRDHHAMAFDAQSGGVIMFGGQEENGAHPAATWAWDGVSWRQVGASGPPPRATHRMVRDPASSRVLLFGGWGPESFLDDFWAWVDGAWQRHDRRDPTPPARGAHRVAYDERRDELVLFGGLGAGGALGDTWILGTDGWRTYDGPAPSARNVHEMAYDADRARVVLYGGSGDDGRLDDLWEWDGAAWTRIDAAEPGR